MFNFKQKGGFGIMHQNANRPLNEALVSQLYANKPLDNLKIGVTWTEERMGGEKVKCTGEITKVEPSGISSPPRLTLRDFENGREVVTWMKPGRGQSKYNQVAKELKFTDGPNKGKAATIEKIREML
ncbi:MAG: hypothetical protein ACRCTP_03640 [Aeromonas popoffii]|uniref:hypothetical protein n=1 Tax=Aeromonas popoffii TaxID=70856 RepID=UPI003F31CD13